MGLDCIGLAPKVTSEYVKKPRDEVFAPDDPLRQHAADPFPVLVRQGGDHFHANVSMWYPIWHTACVFADLDEHDAAKGEIGRDDPIDERMAVRIADALDALVADDERWRQWAHTVRDSDEFHLTDKEKAGLEQHWRQAIPFGDDSFLHRQSLQAFATFCRLSGGFTVS